MPSKSVSAMAQIASSAQLMCAAAAFASDTGRATRSVQPVSPTGTAE